MRRVVAEVGCKGDLSYMLGLVDRLAAVGVWAVKGQTVQRDLITSKNAVTYSYGLAEPDRQYETFTDTFTEWGPVAERCDKLGLRFFLSVFDLPTMSKYPYGVVKIASADITYKDLIEAAPCPIILSTGGATVDEIEQAMSWADHNVELMACTLAYPTELFDANVDRVRRLQDRFNVPVGYSDHTRGIAAADYAFRTGASMVEKHVTTTPGQGGDHDFAVTPTQLADLIDGTVSTDPVIDALVAGTGEIGPMPTETRALVSARRSWHTTRKLEPGHVITDTDVVGLRPASGITVADRIVGLRTTRWIQDGAPIQECDVAWAKTVPESQRVVSSTL